MQIIALATTKYGYCVQVIDNGEVIYEYTAGNCRTESQAVIDPDSPGAASRSQLRRWARQTAEEIAAEWRVPHERTAYDPDLEAQLERCETV
jgi:hypothetical protein